MKKTCLILSLLFFAFRSYGQYYPMFGYHHTWYVSNAVASTSPRSQNDNLVYNIMDATGDTMINNNQYFKAKIYYGNFSQPFDTTLFFREDTTTQQVWLLLNDSGTEKLIYDYSLNKGDSIYLDFDFQDSTTSQYYLKTGWYHVDSTNTADIYAGNRKAIFLSNPHTIYNSFLFRNYPELEWIEQVGSTIIPDYTQRDINNADAHIWGYWWDFYYVLLCSFDDSDKIYHNPVFNYIGYSDSDSCLLSFSSGIMSVNTPGFDINLFPNPCSDMLQLDAHLPQSPFVKIEIFNVTGIRIYDSQIASPDITFQSVIDVSQYPPGMYFLRLSTPDAFEMSKFVKY